MQQDEHANSENTLNLHYLLACFRPHCWGSEITLCHQQSPCCLSFTNRKHSATVLFDIIYLSSPHPATSSFPIESSFQYFGARLLALITWPTYWSLHHCTVVSSRSCGCTSCSSDALVWCAVQLARSNRQYAVISKPCIRLLSTAFTATRLHLLLLVIVDDFH